MSSLNTKCYWNFGYVTCLDSRSSTDTLGEKLKFQLSTKDFQNHAKNTVSHEKILREKQLLREALNLKNQGGALNSHKFLGSGCNNNNW